MTEKKFNIRHRVGAMVAFVVSAITYLLTIEPSASFWDCGEFIASSYRLEVGHPPGNPMFQIIARFFTNFGDNMHAAILINAMSALCSALTIFFLYLTIVWFVRRFFKTKEYNTSEAIVIIASGLVGSLIYCFSDTFWFSAVEGEVYAMSSLFTAIVFWAMTMWYDHSEEPYANKWIVLIAFLMGLSIGVHLLNLLMIPGIVYMYYYRKNENKSFSFWELFKIFIIGVVIIAIILFLIVPYFPKIAAYFDLFFVNVLGLPYNTGAAFFVLGFLAFCFWRLFVSLRKNKVFVNTVYMCLTTIIIGFSVFTVVIIRSSVKTPTNEYQPDNAFTLVRYLSREQYGSAPLVYGHYYDAPYELENTHYWAPLDGKYKKVEGPIQAKYLPEGKMLFPRMWSESGDGHTYEDFYEIYTQGKGKRLRGATHRKPTMAANLLYFFDYQMNWMYWRYFMWNFVGRQNQIHSPSPGNLYHGNWESGIDFIDNARLGDQSLAPDTLANDKGKNHYYFIPLLLGLIGLFFQFDKDKRGSWLVFLMFFMTGIAIVLYLNQQPMQVRERDYAYAGSFYFFSAWCGMAVVALYNLVKKLLGKDSKLVASLLGVLCLLVPVQMAAENWDDHDRSNRRTAVEVASNYLNSVGKNGILITHGDNDTFPTWYAQEVENVRPDVRIVNTSLLGTDWHIDQMKWAVNDSKPLPLTVEHEQYLYGTNEFIPISEVREDIVMDLKDAMELFKNPKVRASMTSGRRVDFLPARHLRMPVNKENVIKYGILDSKFEEQIPDSIILNISKDKDFITKPELFLLDLLNGYEWDRPICLLSMAGDLNVGIKEYLSYQGYNSYLFVPIKNKTTTTEIGFVDYDKLYHNMMNVYKFDAASASDYFIDYQNYYTHLGVNSIRTMFTTSANAFMSVGQTDRALAMLDRCNEIMSVYPLETIPIGFSGCDFMVIDMISLYYKLGQAEKAREIAIDFATELLITTSFYYDTYEIGGKNDFETAVQYIYFLNDELVNCGDKEIADSLMQSLMDIIGVSDEEEKV